MSKKKKFDAPNGSLSGRPFIIVDAPHTIYSSKYTSRYENSRYTSSKRKSRLLLVTHSYKAPQTADFDCTTSQGFMSWNTGIPYPGSFNSGCLGTKSKVESNVQLLDFT